MTSNSEGSEISRSEIIRKKTRRVILKSNEESLNDALYSPFKSPHSSATKVVNKLSPKISRVITFICLTDVGLISVTSWVFPGGKNSQLHNYPYKHVEDYAALQLQSIKDGLQLIADWFVSSQRHPINYSRSERGSLF